MESSTILWILIALIAVAAVAGYTRPKGQKVLGIGKNMFGSLAGVVALFLILAQTGTLADWGLPVGPLAVGGVISESTEGGETITTDQKQPSICPEVTKTVTLSASDAYTSVAAGGTHRYRINNNPAQTVADGGTFSASPGDKLSILFMNESDGQSYFSSTLAYEVPCLGSAIASKNVYKNGTLTIDVYNRDGQKINGVANNQTLAAGDVFTLNTKLTGAYQRGFPYGMVAIVEYNSSQIDDVIAKYGASEQLVSTPAWYTVSHLTSTTKSYAVPALLSNTEVAGQLVIDSDDSINPAQDITITYVPMDYFVNEKNGGAYEGPAVQDENGARVFGTGEQTTTVYID